MKIPFSKYHGAGNDFIIIDNRSGKYGLTSEQIGALCQRHFGIGADGLMLLEDDENSHFRMRYYNSDGNESTMCGNGGRCLVMFAHKLGIINNETTFVGVDGLHSAQIISNNNVRLQMMDVTDIETDDEYYIINTGSPHFIKFVEDLDKIDVITQGRLIRNTYADRGGVNVNFAQFMTNHISIRTYERGVENETLACGTGAVATAIAANHWYNEDKNSYMLTALGGNLTVSFKRVAPNRYENVWLQGPAIHVFDGVVGE